MYVNTLDGKNPKPPPGMISNLVNHRDKLPTSTGGRQISEPHGNLRALNATPPGDFYTPISI